MPLVSAVDVGSATTGTHRIWRGTPSVARRVMLQHMRRLALALVLACGPMYAQPTPQPQPTSGPPGGQGDPAGDPQWQAAAQPASTAGSHNADAPAAGSRN